MRDLLAQIRAALDGNLYYLALFVTLAVPDICAALDSDTGEASAVKYKRWFDSNLGSLYGEAFTGEDCYHFRCSLLHQGTTQHPKGRYARVVFLEPGAKT